MRRGRVSCLLQEVWLDLSEIGIHRGVQRLELLVESQGLDYLPRPITSFDLLICSLIFEGLIREKIVYYGWSPVCD